MKLSNILSMALASTTGAKSIGKPNEVDSLAAESLHRMQAYYYENPLPTPGTCTLDNVAVRRDW